MTTKEEDTCRHRAALRCIDEYLVEVTADVRGGSCFKHDQRREILAHIEHIRDIIFRSLGP
jgi:hypothetical protein